jgi:hypothetical protein
MSQAVYSCVCIIILLWPPLATLPTGLEFTAKKKFLKNISRVTLKKKILTLIRRKLKGKKVWQKLEQYTIKPEK